MLKIKTFFFSMIRKAIPVLVHEDCMGSISAGLAKQEANIANTATATSSINSSVGTTSDASTSNTVIGLLKSIVNKLS